jgi:hypothetical protein
VARDAGRVASAFGHVIRTREHVRKRSPIAAERACTSARWARTLARGRT